MQSKWDERYRDAVVDEESAAPLLVQHRNHLPHAGLALDLACGLGANGILLARAGLQVEAWDLSGVAVEKLNQYGSQNGLTLHATVRDVIAEPPPPNAYDVIVVSRFLERELCPSIAAALRPGGLLFYQTFCGDGPGPTNPAFRLKHNELPQLFSELEPLIYGEDENRGEAWLVAVRAAGV